MTSFLTSLTSKGQTTIPHALREKMGLETGDKVLFVWENEQVIIRKAPSFATPAQEWLQGVAAGLTEWHSAEDEVFNDL
jgi:antitoxin PrlF